ncbi:MAG: DUF134 domain-containing protein [Eubacteriales bacterium]|nr:DUF134 domain-containing protein [Eubacteriales bacterium]
MPRPKKCRRVCGPPGCSEFAPRGSGCCGQTVCMGLDEYEAVRLIDLEGLQQEQAAAQMGVARTTVQAIYNAARRKLADCVVNGKTLRIEGGDVEVCQTRAHCPRSGCCPRRDCQNG